MGLPATARRLAAAAALLPLSGCCDLALWWCGPDKSHWVAQSFLTPDEALATFVEATRRDRPDIVYRALSEGFKQRVGLPGAFEAAVGWERLKEQYSGIHLLARATISPAERLADDRVRYRLELRGYRFDVELVRLAWVGLRYDVDGASEPLEAFVGELRDHIALGPGLIPSSVRLEVPLDGAPDDVLDRLEGIGAGYRWKIDHLAQVTDEDS